MTLNRTFSVNPGSVVSWRDANWTVAELDGFDRVLAVRVDTGRREFIALRDLGPALPEGSPEKRQEIARRLEQSQLRKSEPSEFILRPKQQRADQQHLDLLEIAAMPKGRRKTELERFAERHGCHLATAYRKLKLVEAGVGADGMRLQRSDKGKVGVRKGVRAVEVIEEHLRTYHFVETKRTVRSLLDVVNLALASEGLPRVGLSLLYAVRNQTTFRDRLLASGRNKEARDVFRAKVGHLPNNDYPLGTVQIDHTPCQICFVDSVDRVSIGTATLTLVVDSYSRMILGYYIGFENASAHAAGLALSHAFLPKEKQLEELGITDAEWPCWGLPDVILCDNAQELNGTMMQAARQEFRFTIRNRPAGQPQFGGHAETVFKTFMNEWKTIPGTQFSNPRERGEYNSEENAIFTLDEFRWYFTYFVLNIYHLREHKGFGMEGRTPLQRWKAGLLEGDVFPPTGLPERPANEKALQIAFMPLTWRVIANSTISLHDLTYYSHALDALARKGNPRMPLARRKFEVRYMPMDVRVCWVRDPETGEFIECRNSEFSKPIPLWLLKQIKKERGKPSATYETHRGAALLKLEAKKQTAAKETKRIRRENERKRKNAADSIQTENVGFRFSTKPRQPEKSQLDMEEMLSAMMKKLGG
jgi:putative transposase